MLQSFGKSLSDFPPMPKADTSLVPDVESRLIHDEMSYNRPVLAAQHDRMMSTMTSEQRNVYDKIMTRVKEDKPGLFFLYGYGGTGKTFIWRALCAALRSDGEIVLACASSGIAALLIPGGRTAHSRFGILFTIDECSMCGVTPNTPLASLLIKAKLIIWDEAPMMHKHCFEALDRSLRDVLKTVDKRNKDIPFGGKVVVLGGDFRQILPVMLGSTRPEFVNASINSSHLWRYCEVLTLTKNMRLLSSASESDIEERKLFSDWVLRVGDGTIGEVNDVDISVVIPSDLLIPSSGNPIAYIVDSTYPNLLGNIGKAEYFQSRAILAPKNTIVEQVNDYVLDLIPGEEKIYLSYDTPYHKNIDGDAVDDIHTPEFLNTIVASKLPNHRLRLKVGAPVMLLRNMDQSLGLCNGTRLIITKMGKFVLEGRVISGSNIGEKVFIPRLSLTPSDNRIPFKFKRRQFPISVSFSMTINKSQGQSLEHVGVYLPGGLKILINDDDDDDIDVASNVVYREVFRNGAVCLPNMFGGDFGDQIGRYAILTNPKSNKFEVLVDRVNRAFFSQRDGKRFVTFTESILVPGLPWFLLMNLQATFDDYLPPITSLLAYRHNITDMVLDFEKKLTEYDVTKGCMILLYTGNVPQMLDTLKTTVNIIDDCGNLWVCELNFATFPYEHFKIGRRWNRFVEARRLREGVKIRRGCSDGWVT
ncbi:PIF1-like helicase [Medicago truncatula]|uniref:ATP-dependent DNA helicase n=1 Tax=Medicago truncatula TaxID=3880 RepID=A0A072V4M5_MEDTR|nr:PIF1-like helicase [Medicago truncatula]